LRWRHGRYVKFNEEGERRMVTMKGEHCHANGVCHDHPDDGRDYG
jgi:hypothetical protein